ncbi:MAG TPA: hypothetical protein VN327_03310 [Pseudonocardiaceae bacterium]|jgi:hypothetical protein|nr:hypothetical protein [Pseudonocardiaceae bacterium]
MMISSHSAPVPGAPEPADRFEPGAFVGPDAGGAPTATDQPQQRITGGRSRSDLDLGRGFHGTRQDLHTEKKLKPKRTKSTTELKGSLF